MSTIAELSGISAGAFTVNGKSISVDPAVDSLTALLSRIEGSGAGVTASYSEGTGLVTIKNTDASLPLSLSSGSTGLFPALGITDGTRTPQTATGRGLSASRAARVADAMESVANELSRLFDSSEGAPARVGTLRSTLREAVTEALDTDKDRARTSFGVTFDFRGGRRNVFSFDDQDRESLVRQLRQNPDVVRQLFFGDGPDDEQSLGNLFLGALDDARRDIGRELGRTGVFVNAIA
jgi:flagellar hook-associated protein 2